EQVEKLAKELLDKEVLHQSDVEELIGKRPFEEKKIIDVQEHPSSENQTTTNTPTETNNINVVENSVTANETNNE
ncbi:MAG TPA: hypothetical protein PLH33_08520, partial [Chitinophagaceae bacterium]|nr:hypothetical protein [Chitinophagaceae bacterium]